jgi:hypothetical protein
MPQAVVIERARMRLRNHSYSSSFFYAVIIVVETILTVIPSRQTVSIFDLPSDRRIVSSASDLFPQRRLAQEQISNPALCDDITA